MYLKSSFRQRKNIVACFANAGTVEARSIESGTQQKENELLCNECATVAELARLASPPFPSLRVAVA
jgi:hypothetical protein